MLLITDQMPRTSALSLTVKRGVVQVERSTGGLSDALDALHCRILARKECMISSPISRNV